MEKITHLLTKYEHITPPDGALRKVVAEAIKEVCHITIPQKHIRVTRDNVYLMVDPAIKSKVFMTKEMVTQYVHARLGNTRTLKDIR